MLIYFSLANLPLECEYFNLECTDKITSLKLVCSSNKVKEFVRSNAGMYTKYIDTNSLIKEATTSLNTAWGFLKSLEEGQISIYNKGVSVNLLDRFILLAKFPPDSWTMVPAPLITFEIGSIKE